MGNGAASVKEDEGVGEHLLKPLMPRVKSAHGNRSWRSWHYVGLSYPHLFIYFMLDGAVSI